MAIEIYRTKHEQKILAKSIYPIALMKKKTINSLDRKRFLIKNKHSKTHVLTCGKEYMCDASVIDVGRTIAQLYNYV